MLELARKKIEEENLKLTPLHHEKELSEIAPI